MSNEYYGTPFRKKYLGFFLDNKRRINWRNVDHADISEIVKVRASQGDLRPLNNLLEDLAYSDVYKDDFINTGPETYKMIKIMQCGLQYFLHSQAQLKETCRETHIAAEKEAKENKLLKDAIKKQKLKIKKIKKEIENIDLRAMHYDIITEVLKPEGDLISPTNQ